MKEIELPDLVCLEDYEGDTNKYIKALYKIFKRDFIKNKLIFRGQTLGLKYHPERSGKAYTFYHMTTKGRDEANRKYDFKRCERMPWARPCIANADDWQLKVFEQKRKNENRVCIWLEFKDESDYFIVLNKRKGYLLLWTAFAIERDHEKRKKQREYERWLRKGKGR